MVLSLHELVKDKVNGLVFSDAAQLAEQLEVSSNNLPPKSKA